MLHAKVMRVRKSGTDKQRLSEFRNYNSTGADNKSSVRLKRRVGAAMPRKLQPETFLRVAHVLKIAERNLELAVATCAHSNRRNRPQPLHHSKITLHFKLPLCEGAAIPPALPHSLFNLRNPVRTLQNFPRLRTVRGSYNSILLHQVD